MLLSAVSSRTLKVPLSSLVSSLFFGAVLSAQPPLSYNFDVKPILSDRCFLCHGFDDSHRAADLRLDISEEAFRPRKGKTPIVPGHPEQSDVWRRIISQDPDLVMPTPESHLTLTDNEKATIKRWIVEGAPYEKHWSFIPPQRPTIPKVSNPKWVKNPIDAFILATLDRENLAPSPPASATTITRRLSLDLIGLPPQSLDQSVSSLLNSPAFGEKWTFTWLEAGRYADSNGFQGDPDRYAYPWRDYLIRSLNDNKPQNQLIIELLAGDLLENPSQDQLVATAFNRNHLINDEGGALPDEILYNYHLDRVDATATTFLGLTFACAQCHDHKYDPVTHEDYFSFMAFFSNMDEQAQPRVIRKGPKRKYKLSEPTLSLKIPELEQQLAPLRQSFNESKAALAPYEEQLSKAEREWALNLPKDEVERLPFPTNFAVPNIRNNRGLNQEQRTGLRDYYTSQILADENLKHLHKVHRHHRRELQKVEAQVPVVMIMKDRDSPASEHLRTGGAYDAPSGDPLFPRIPAILGTLPPEVPKNRLTLARWLVSRDNPLTARVLVNRLWQEIFGVGLVKTSEDFGYQGELPSHPELLDWLAVEFIESGWDFKHLVRLIVESSTYRQSSRLTSQLREKDPENRLLARGPRFRLRATVIRDQALAVSGLLQPTLYGPPVFPPQPDGLWKEVSFGGFGYPHHTEPAQIHRRSLYTFWRRTLAPPNMFDSSDRQLCSVKPSTTNTPLQALTLMNDPTYTQAAQALAEQAQSHPNPINFIFLSVTNRAPTEKEYQILEKAYQRELSTFPQNPELKSLTLVATTILNLDETITKQ